MAVVITPFCPFMTNIIPENDEREHVESMDCWCNPEVRWKDPETGELYNHLGPLVVHQALDCREFCEHVTGEPLAEDKRWEIFYGEE